MTRYDAERMQEIKMVLDRALLPHPGVTARQMFGVPAWLAGGKVFVLLVTGGVVITRLDEDDRQEMSARFATLPFVGHGSVVRRWVQVVISGPEDIDPLLVWIEKSYRAALAL